MNNFDKAIESTETGLNSAGSAMHENEAYLNSINGKIELVRNQFEQLVNGDGGLNSFVKLMLDAATAILTFLNSGAGKLSVTLAAISVAFIAVNKYGLVFAESVLGLLGKNILLAIASGQGFIGVLQAMTANIAALSAAEKTSLILFAASAVVAGIYLISKAFGSLTESIEEQTEALDDAYQAYTENQTEIKNLKSQLEDVKSKIDEVNQLKLQVTNQDDLRNLQAQSTELAEQETTLRNQLAYQLAKEESVKRELENRATIARDSQDYTTYSYDPDSGHKNIDTGSGSLTDSVDSAIEVITKLQEEQAEVNKQLEELEESGDTASETYQDLVEQSTEYQEAINELIISMDDTIDAADSIVEANQDTKGSVQELLDKWYDFIGVTEQVDSTVEKTENILDGLTDSITEVNSAYSALSQAQDEYNQYGAISISTLNTLLEKYPQYIQYLYDENGNINLNTEALKLLAEARKADALQQVAQAEAADLQAYSEGNLNEVSATGQAILQGYANKVEAVGSAAETAANKVVDYAYAVAAANVASGQPVEGADLEGLNALKEGWDAIRQSIADADAGTQSFSSSSSSASKSSTKAAEDTTDAWKEAFEERKDELDHLLAMEEITEEEYYEMLMALNEEYYGEASGMHEKYLEEYRKNEEAVYKGLASVVKEKIKAEKEAAIDAIDDMISAVKKEKEAALESIDAQIDALKKQKEAALDAVDAEIKALEKAKQKQHDYFQEKIDALQKAHDLQEQINQLEEYENQLAQAKATKVWVMKDGQFQLGEDESSVASAEQQLSDYKDEMDYEQQLQELQDLQDYWDEYYDNLIEQKEEYRDYLEEYYDAQIEALEEYRDQVEEYYEEQLEALEEQKEALEEYYEEMLENYKQNLDAMLEKFAQFIEDNKGKYSTALDDLRAFVTEWNALVGSMESIGGGTAGGLAGTASVSKHSDGAAEIGSYASGNGYAIKDSEIALVGESPNTEMLIGSKINTGIIARLHKGSGVVNAESTRTLAGLLNHLGDNKLSSNNTGNNSTVQHFSFGNLSLPNVTDANSFVEALKTTFGSYAIQYANAKA